eukprot:5569566-Heterocapsa_arctica.AAC.1
MFCALAHVKEDVARDFAPKILEAWNQDPRQEVHHRLTWKLMRPGSFFREGLELFIAGTLRRDLPQPFLQQVASFRFPAAVETTIEEKHARVSMAKRCHHVGPVRISLANRLPMLERALRSGSLCPKRLLS